MSYPNSFEATGQDPRQMSSQNEQYRNKVEMVNAELGKARPIDTALGQLNLVIDGLQKIITVLEGRLGPYLQPEDSSKREAGTGVPSPKSNVVNQIEQSTIAIDGARAHLFSLIERID